MSWRRPLTMGEACLTTPASPLLCPFDDCSKTFNTYCKLKKHQKAHITKDEFVCEYQGCDKKYSLKHHLKRHIEKCHSDVNNNEETCRTFPCKQCSKILKSKDSLAKHVKSIHLTDRLKCTHCGKQFLKLQHLKIHEYDHTGMKPFVCSIEGCGKSYLIPSRLKAHEKTHKGYKCPEVGCEAVFNIWSKLRKHKTEHEKKPECKICGRSFQSKKNLKSHMATHDDLRECFHCPHEGCTRYYYFKNNLDQHIRYYHEEKKLECPTPNCGERFVNKAKLNYHLSLKICNKRKKSRRKNPLRTLASKLTGLTNDGKPFEINEEEKVIEETCKDNDH